MKYKYFYSLNSKSFCIQKLKPSTTQFSIHKKTVPVRERAYNDLKSDLLSGRFAPGERLTEEHLAKSLGVSRTPVREALHKLESEGLVKPLESRGFYVALDSREELEDLFDIRAALEGYAIRLICEKISAETIQQLNEFILKAEDAFARNQLDEIFEYNTQFHDALHNVLSRKTRLHTLIADTRKFVLRYRKDSLHYIDGARRTIILMAISLKDPELCERVMRQHVREAKEEALHRYLLEKNDDR